MIDKNEIDKKAQEFEIHTSNLQRDYIFGWVLFALFTESNLKDTIFLKGGNALRKGYFENTRFSYDLDFGIPNDIEQSELLTELNKICDIVERKSGVHFIKEDNQIKEKFTATNAPIPDLKVYEVRIYFNDFYGKKNHLKIKISMDITRFDKTLLPIQEVDLIHPYSDAHEVVCKIRCMKLEEIIATKLKCLLQRQHAPDLFDYVYSVKLLGGNLDKDEVVKTFVQKTIFGNNPHVLKNILYKTPFDYFKECWTKTIVCAKKVIFGVDEAISFFVENLEELFNIYPDNGFDTFAYFGPELRVPIMEAGRTQTLLKVRYQGYDRLVEPYSLKYKESKKGQKREYFYVWDCSGGSSQPGIKSLVSDGFESIENTKEKFEPRRQIELSKSGETPENPFLFDPNKPMRAPNTHRVRSFRRTRSQSSYGPTYIYQCSSCGKKFNRKTMDSTRRKHKSKEGFDCYEYAVYVDMKY